MLNKKLNYKIIIIVLICFCFNLTSCADEEIQIIAAPGIDTLENAADLQELLLSLQTESGGFADQLLPTLRLQLYDTFYAVEALKLLGYDLEKLAKTNDWLMTFDFAEMMKREDGAVDLLYYLVGLYDSFGITLTNEIIEQVIKYFQALQSEEGYFFYRLSDKNNANSDKGYNDSMILTATNTICEIFKILEIYPTYLDRLNAYNESCLYENVSNNNPINQLEKFSVIMTIDESLNGEAENEKKEYIQEKAKKLLAMVNEAYQITNLSGTIALGILENYVATAGVNEKYLEDYLKEQAKLLADEFAGQKYTIKQSQFSYQDLVFVAVNGEILDNAVKERIIDDILGKMCYQGYFDFREPMAPRVLDTYIAARNLAFLGCDDKVVKENIKRFAQNKLDTLDLNETPREIIYTLILAEACGIDLADKTVLEILNKLKEPLKDWAPTQQLMFLCEINTVLERFQIDMPKEWQSAVAKWLESYEQLDLELAATEKVIEACNLAVVASMAAPKEERQAVLEKRQEELYSALEALPAEEWEQYGFVFMLLFFFTEHEWSITFNDSLPSVEKFHSAIKENLQIGASTAAIYTLLAYTMATAET